MSEKVAVSFKCSPDVMRALDAAALEQARARAHQVLWYVLEGLKRDGRLPEGGRDGRKDR